ncbi:pyridoxal phosphate-dependent aminotransferase [Lichenicola cladoniae]|uniref:Aminotransferase n=1 Tax=Lichenicola cladoniae TaxID=1484109 RepID=A0A6M8HLZ5_9PROT|nr:pyridoxal phosphate-dependent aminotransferase [Lichenicola cladoniae]NPD66840.1 pyridoxal phosphate-dependent aminotransferase [Acetobacteraceae bacterium]QKE89403.1 pyridoxal phosphate-dependent aminotransferase [Lichenicola cladoniae]
MDSLLFRSDTLARPGVEMLPGSLIREVAQEGLGLQGVIPLWFGEPDSVTPGFIRDAAKRALDDGQTFYTSNYGIYPLREAIARYQGRLGRISAPERVSVTSSGVNAILLACQTILAPGDRVVLPVPAWPNLAGIAAVVGAEVTAVPLRLHEARWQLDLDELLAALTPDTRMVILNAPANPTGAMLTRDEMVVILAHCRRHGIWILADDVYERVVFERDVAPSFLELADVDDRVVSINSFSKSWAMTGWRLGWITAPPALMSALGKITEFNTSCAPGFVQSAGIVALEQGEPFVAAMRARLQSRRDIAADLLDAIPGITTPRPEGAMYAFMRIAGCTDSLALAKSLLREARVGVAPGRAFGESGEGCLRLCFAVEEATLREAIGRIAAYFRMHPLA